MSGKNLYTQCVTRNQTAGKGKEGAAKETLLGC